MVGGFASWIIMPSLLACLMTHDAHGVILRQSGSTLWWTYFFGCLWGLGGLTFGLTMRYLGMSLGMGVALGYCAAFGTLLPPIAKLFLPAIPVDETIVQIASTPPAAPSRCPVIDLVELTATRAASAAPSARLMAMVSAISPPKKTASSLRWKRPGRPTWMR